MKSAVLIAIFGVLASASPTTNYAVHEKRREHPQWVKVASAPADKVMSMRVGLQQNNFDKADAWLDEVSNPTSPKYGQHWAVADVINAFRPT